MIVLKLVFLLSVTILTQELLVLFGPQFAVGVGHTDAKLLGAFHQQLPLGSRDCVSDLSTVLLVLHHQNFQLLQRRIQFLKKKLLDLFFRGKSTRTNSNDNKLASKKCAKALARF